MNKCWTNSPKSDNYSPCQRKRRKRIIIIIHHIKNQIRESITMSFQKEVIYIYIPSGSTWNMTKKIEEKNFSFIFWIYPAPSPPLIHHCRMVTTTTLPTTEYVFLTALDLSMIVEQHNTMMSNYDKHHIWQPYRMNETTQFTHIEMYGTM